MTRINLVPPAELMDQHLMAEFREIKMVPQALKRTLVSMAKQHKTYKDLLDSLPTKFTLGTGHVKFFFNKAAYLQQRYFDIIEELLVRGFAIDQYAPLDKDHVFSSMPYEFNCDYAPSAEDLILIRARIAEKIAMKPSWYRYTGEVKE